MSNKVLLFDQSLSKLHILFKLSGINLNNKIENVTDSFKHRWLYTLNCLWVLCAMVASIYYIITGISNGKDFLEVTSVAPCVTFTILAMIKSLFHLSYENRISQLIEKLRYLENKENERAQSIDRDEIVNKERAFLNAVINVLYILNCLMLVVFDVTPLVMMAAQYYKAKEFEMLLPFLNVFTFIPYDFKYWAFAYVHQIWSECISLLAMAAVDYLFFTYCTYITMQFKLLQHDFERVIPAQAPSDLYADPEFREKFNELVMWHQDLIDSSKILEIIYSKSTLFNFLTSSLVICLTGFNVTIVDDFVVVITFLTFFFMGLMQVFFLCFFADMLLRASVEVSNAVYRSHWYFTDISIGKKILMVQTRAQDPCKLSAAGFAEVNLRAFMKVLSTSWSYFALLQTIYGR